MGQNGGAPIGLVYLHGERASGWLAKLGSKEKLKVSSLLSLIWHQDEQSIGVFFVTLYLFCLFVYLTTQR